MGQNSSRLNIPNIKSVKSLTTFQEYPSCTLNQIFEAYGYWLNSDVSRKGTLFSNEFEEVFGQLFPDPLIHFQRLQDVNMGACITMDVFNLFILLADASMENKLKAIYEISNKDSKVPMKLDAIQGLFFKLITSFRLVFFINIPTRDEVNYFIESSLRQFIERTHLYDDSSDKVDSLTSGKDPSGRKDNNNAVKSRAQNPGTTVGNQAAPTIILTQNMALNFRELWQWCQDVHQISQFLESIEEVCLHVTQSVDRTHKGKQWVQRNSFFSSNSFSAHTSVLRSSMQAKTPRQENNKNGVTTDNLMDIMQQVIQKVGQVEYFDSYLSEKRHPLWKNSIKSMVTDSWFNNLPMMYSDQKVFTGLEHMILSQQRMIPILHRNSPQPNANTSSNASAGSKANLSSFSVKASTTPTGHRMSNFTPHPPMNIPAPSSALRLSSQGSHRFSASPGSAGGGFGLGYHKVDLLGIIDYGSILSWMIESSPPIIFRELKKQEQIVRSKRLSFEFSLHHDEDTGSTQLTDTRGNVVELPRTLSMRGNSELMIDTDDLEDGEGTDEDEDADERRMNDLTIVNRELDEIREEEEDDDSQTLADSEAGDQSRLSTAQSQSQLNPTARRLSMSRGSTNAQSKPVFTSLRYTRSRIRSVTSNKWNAMGEMISSSALEKIFYAKSFPSYHMKFENSNYLMAPLLTNDQAIYNVILYIAKGYRHVPVTLEPLNIHKVYHIIHSGDVAQYLFESYHEFFSFPSAGNNNNSPTKEIRPAENPFSPLRNNDTNNSPQKNAPNQNNQSLLNRPVIWTGLMKKAVFICNPAHKIPTVNIKEGDGIKAEEDVKRASKTIKHNFGSILHQLLQSNLDSILITNEKNQVVTVLSLNIVEEIWWNWKKRNLPKNLMNILQLSDLLGDYEAGVYSVFEEESGNDGVDVGNNNTKPNSANNQASSAALHRASTSSNASFRANFVNQQNHRTSTSSTFTPAKGIGFNNNAEQGTPYPFGYSSTLNNNNAATTTTNSNGSKYHHSLFSIFMNSLEACKDLLNITLIDFDDFIMLDEERALAAAAPNTTLKSGSPINRGKTGSPKNFKRDANRVPPAISTDTNTTDGVNKPPEIPLAPSEPSNSVNNTNPSSTNPQDPPASTAPTATATDDGNPKSPKARKTRGGKVVKKYGNFSNLAAFQQHLQREKEKEESRIRAAKTRKLESWFSEMKVMTVSSFD